MPSLTFLTCYSAIVAVSRHVECARGFAFPPPVASRGGVVVPSRRIAGPPSPVLPPPRSPVTSAMRSAYDDGDVIVNPDDDDDDDRIGPSLANVVRRDHFLSHVGRATATLASIGILMKTTPSRALVRGNAPPPKKSYNASGGDASMDAIKCRNVEECQELAEREETLRMQRYAEMAESGPKPAYAPGGTRYLDIVGDGIPSMQSNSILSSSSSTTSVARAGDVVDVHYKVLKIGKRSYDGLSGEGTVIFSRGYGLEDDEDGKSGDRAFRFTIGDERVIGALNDAVPGMAVGTTRRISVTPRNGWEKNTRSCDGGPGGLGAGGELRTDYVVVPTATMVEQESCFDKTKLPFPTTYAQERRMAQRFDQSLILEVRLVGIS